MWSTESDLSGCVYSFQKCLTKYRWFDNCYNYNSYFDWRKGMVKCQNGIQCIYKSDLCSCSINCKDGSDESPEVVMVRLTIQM